MTKYTPEKITADAAIMRRVSRKSAVEILRSVMECRDNHGKPLLTITAAELTCLLSHFMKRANPDKAPKTDFEFVATCVAQEETRRYLQFVHYDKERRCLEATDGHCLHWIEGVDREREFYTLDDLPLDNTDLGKYPDTWSVIPRLADDPIEVVLSEALFIRDDNKQGMKMPGLEERDFYPKYIFRASGQQKTINYYANADDPTGPARFSCTHQPTWRSIVMPRRL